MPKKKFYISGPISKLPQEEYTTAFGRAEAMLLDMDHEPVNPLKLPACESEDCAPAGSVKEDGSFLHSWQCYLKYDLKGMLDCDAIALLPGWRRSLGAQLELDVAKKVGLEIFGVNHDYRGLIHHGTRI